MYNKASKKRRVSEDEGLIPAEGGWPTTEEIAASTPKILEGRLSFTNAFPILNNYAAVPVVLADTYEFKGDEPQAERSDGSYSTLIVYHPQAAPMGYEQLCTTAATTHVKRHKMHKLNGWPCFMIVPRDAPTIELTKGSRMYDIQFRRLDPNNEEHRKVFDMIPDHIKERYGVVLTSATKVVHEGEDPIEIPLTRL